MTQFALFVIKVGQSTTNHFIWFDMIPGQLALTCSHSLDCDDQVIWLNDMATEYNYWIHLFSLDHLDNVSLGTLAIHLVCFPVNNLPLTVISQNKKHAMFS